MRTPCVLAPLVALVLGACTTVEPYDYTLFEAHRPRSVLVLPPLDQSMEVEASYAYLATITRPLAERGYYVFPVAVVDRMLRDNGLSVPGEMHQAPLERLRDVFGADAVLYVTLKDWGTSFRVLDSATEVTVEAHLVDTASGTEIWAGEHTAEYHSGSGGGSILGALIGAVVNQIATSISDPSAQVARECNQELFCDERRGLLLGPHHPEYVGGP
ncbi:MAG TPA: GNA1162 family protein [Planctomycetota bacterium]